MNLGSVESFSVSPLIRGLCLGFFALVQFANTLDFEAGLAVATIPLGADLLADVVAAVVGPEAFWRAVGDARIGFEGAGVALFVCAADIATVFSCGLTSFGECVDVEDADSSRLNGGGETALSIGSPSNTAASECRVPGRLSSDALVVLENVLRLFATGGATPLLIGEAIVVLVRLDVAVVGRS